MREVGAKLETLGALLVALAIVALCVASQLPAEGTARQVAWAAAAIGAVLMFASFAFSAFITGEQRFRGSYVVRGGPAYLSGAAFACVAVAGTIALIGHVFANGSAEWMLTAMGVGMLGGGFLMPSVGWGYVQNGLPQHRYLHAGMALWLGLVGLVFFGCGVLLFLVGVGVVPRELLHG